MAILFRLPFISVVYSTLRLHECCLLSTCASKMMKLNDRVSRLNCWAPHQIGSVAKSGCWLVSSMYVLNLCACTIRMDRTSLSFDENSLRKLQNSARGFNNGWRSIMEIRLNDMIPTRVGNVLMTVFRHDKDSLDWFKSGMNYWRR